MPTNKGRRKVEDKGQHLIDQAARARRFADQCGSPLVRDLYEIHASLCEAEAEMRKPKKSKEPCAA